ncbi:hypothetical protein OO015_13795 (plasmid) [Thermomicrobium sp. 4228-Ro]|uniref:hypothetical protein n=1 Tax=Thermomicrobium sp. 4228-Ro TaxID=2993937 RepID=UPI0022488C0D|nr:hypothetical protein [Thermomicrobium sp. 4228-Ro]MCX2728558.1 hypothetical protein [Thermomicrobium sp. 4228-Ro]
MVEAGNIVYRVTADFSDLARAQGQAEATFERIGAEGEAAFAEITRAIDEAAQLIAGSLAAAFDLSPERITAGAGAAAEALRQLRSAAEQASMAALATEADQAGDALAGQATEAAEAAQATAQLGEAGERARGGIEGLLERLGRFGMAAFGIQQAAQALDGLLRPLAEFGKSAIDAASDANESFSKLQAVFQDSTMLLTQTLENAATAMGLSRGEAAEALATFGNLFTSMGLTRQQAAEMSAEFVQLAADLASFNNLTLDEALEKLRSGIVGEIEPLRSLGISFNEAAVQAKVLEMGLASSEKEITEQDKILARYQLILEMTANAQGDFARTSDQLANSQRILRAQLQNVREQLGSALLPLLTDIVQAGARFLDWFQKLPGPVRDVTIAVAALGIALGTVLPAIGAAAIAIGAVSAPVVGAVAAIGALAAGAIVLARNWDTIREKFPTLARAVDTVRGAFAALWDGVRTVWPAVQETIAGAIELVLLQFERLKVQLSGFARLIVAAFSGEWGKIDDILRETDQELRDVTERQVEAGRRIVDAWRNVGQSAQEQLPHFYDMFTALREGGQAAQEVQQQFTSTIDVFTQFDAAIGASNQAISRWQGQLREAQEALGQLEQKRRSGVELTAEEQAQYETLTWYVGRLQGGIADLESQQRSILVAQAEYTRALDDLNAKLQEGQITQEEYNRRVGELNSQYSAALGPAEAFRQAGERVADALGQVAERLEDVLRGLGLLPPEVEIDIQSTAQQQAEHIRRLNMEIDSLPSSFTITANVNIAPAMDNLAKLGRNIPQSPAEEGPLSKEPDWGWLFRGLVESAEKSTNETIERLRTFVGSVRDVMGALRETFQVVAVWRQQGDPWEAAWGELLDWFGGLSERALSGIADAARKFDGEVLGRARDLLDAVGNVMRVLRDTIDVVARWQEVGDPWDMAWGEVAGWLANLTTEMIDSLSQAADVVGLQATVKAQQLSEAMQTVMGFVGDVFRVAESGTVTILANLQTLWANRDTIGRSIAELAVSLVESVQQALAQAGTALPSGEQTEGLFGPLGQVVGILDRMGRLTEEGIGSARAAMDQVRELGQAIAGLAAELATAVSSLADTTAIPDRDVTERLFAPLQAVANLLSTMSRLGQGEDGARVDPRALVDMLLSAVRQVVDGLSQLASVQLPPLDQLASLLAVLDVVERVSQTLGGAMDRLTQTVNPQRAAGAAAGFAGALRSWVEQLAGVAQSLDPAVVEAVQQVADAFAPIADLVRNVGAVLDQAGNAPRDWQARIDAFAQAVQQVLVRIAAIRDQMQGGLEGLAQAVAQWNAALGSLAGTTGGAGNVSVNATQNLSFEAQLAADVQVRVWVGETELRSIVRQEVDAAVRDALLNAV